MPGIVGLLTRMPRARAQLELLRMVEALRHENFYATGTWVDESLGVYVGWIVRKDSFSDGMPLSNEQGDVESGIPSEKESFRSEEHTSELQSRLHLVCRLLLEKKKKKMRLMIITISHTT